VSKLPKLSVVDDPLARTKLPRPAADAAAADQQPTDGEPRSPEPVRSRSVASESKRQQPAPQPVAKSRLAGRDRGVFARIPEGLARDLEATVLALKRRRRGVRQQDVLGALLDEFAQPEDPATIDALVKRVDRYRAALSQARPEEESPTS